MATGDEAPDRRIVDREIRADCGVDSLETASGQHEMRIQIPRPRGVRPEPTPQGSTKRRRRQQQKLPSTQRAKPTSLPVPSLAFSCQHGRSITRPVKCRLSFLWIRNCDRRPFEQFRCILDSSWPGLGSGGVQHSSQEER